MENQQTSRIILKIVLSAVILFSVTMTIVLGLRFWDKHTSKEKRAERYDQKQPVKSDFLFKLELKGKTDRLSETRIFFEGREVDKKDYVKKSGDRFLCNFPFAAYSAELKKYALVFDPDDNGKELTFQEYFETDIDKGEYFFSKNFEDIFPEALKDETKTVKERAESVPVKMKDQEEKKKVTEAESEVADGADESRMRRPERKSPPASPAFTGKLKLSVKNRDTGEAVQGAIAYLKNGEDWRAVSPGTDTSGVTEVKNLPNAPFLLSIRREGYEDYELNIEKSREDFNVLMKEKKCHLTLNIGPVSALVKYRGIVIGESSPGRDFIHAFPCSIIKLQIHPTDSGKGYASEKREIDLTQGDVTKEVFLVEDHYETAEKFYAEAMKTNDIKLFEQAAIQYEQVRMIGVTHHARNKYLNAQYYAGQIYAEQLFEYDKARKSFMKIRETDAQAKPTIYYYLAKIDFESNNYRDVFEHMNDLNSCSEYLPDEQRMEILFRTKYYLAKSAFEMWKTSDDAGKDKMRKNAIYHLKDAMVYYDKELSADQNAAARLKRYNDELKELLNFLE